MTFDTMDDYPRAATNVRELLAASLQRAAGAAVLALAAALIASLVTWNVDDPSFSFAADGPAANLMGRPGAAFADLAMQFLGLAVVGFLLPLLALGWALVRLRRPRRWIGQAFAWLGGTALLAGALACLPVMGVWPLPTGLGGAVGDVTLEVPQWFAGGELSAGLYAALGVVLGGLALGLLWSACLARPARSAAVAARSAPRRRPRRPAAEEDDDADDGESASGNRLRLAAGWLAHWGLSGRALLRRTLARRAERLARERAEAAAAGPRREPRFAAGAAPDETDFDPPFGADEDDEADGDFDPHFAPEPARSASPRPSPAAKSPPALVAPRARPIARSAEAPRGAGGGEFQLPPLKLLAEPQQRRRDPTLDRGSLEQNARLLEGVLDDFGVRGEIINVRPGPVVTLYELEPAPGIKSSRVISLADDIARSMSAIAARVAVIPGKNAIGIELPNGNRETVFLREMVASGDFNSTKAKLALALGKTIGGEPVIADLAKMPHLLVAGTTGSGKSVAINTMILALTYRLTPEQCRLIMIDPKMLELSVYDGIPHLLTPVVTDPKKAVVALKWTVREMEDRYRKMSKLGVRNIDGFNQRIALAAKKGEQLTRTVQTGFDEETGDPVFETEELDLEPMPYIVVIIDEMADLMIVAGKEIEGAVQRLAQMARAAGIHVIMATQRPSVDVITGTIKANFPTRISFQVTSKIDSRTILGEQGAEQLLGQGDMLYMAGGGRIQRVHGPFVSDEEVELVVAHLKAQGAPDYLDSITAEDDGEGGGFDPAGLGGSPEESADLYDQAVAVVLRDRKVSTSYIQRRLSIGYNRAASIIEKMEKEGVVGPANHAGKREILVGENAA